MGLEITESAANMVRQTIDEKKDELMSQFQEYQENKEITAEANQEPEIYLRLGVKGGGCSGFQYALDITPVKGELDEVVDMHGVKMICDPKSFIYLNGTVLDYKDDGMMQRGFVFNNPNATHSCGCGSSFSA